MFKTLGATAAPLLFYLAISAKFLAFNYFPVRVFRTGQYCCLIGTFGLAQNWLGAQFLYWTIGWNRVGQIIVVVFKIHEIRDIKEGVALEADVDEG